MTQFKKISTVLKAYPALSGGKTVHIVSCTNRDEKSHRKNLNHIKNGETGHWNVAEKRKVPIKKGDVVVVVMSPVGKEKYPKEIYCGTMRTDIEGKAKEKFIFLVNYINKKKPVAQVAVSLGIQKFLGTNTPQGNTVRSIPRKDSRSLSSKTIKSPNGWLEKSMSPEELGVLRSIVTNKTLADTQKTAEIQARIGQGKFRNDVLKKWRCRCAVTGLSEKGLLVASHIVPWIDCKDGDDRVNPLNALLLTPNIDRLFDSKALHLISFNEVGDMLYRSDITTEQKMVIQQIVPRHLSSTWQERGFKPVELIEIGKFLKEHQGKFTWELKRELDNTYFQSAKPE